MFINILTALWRAAFPATYASAWFIFWHLNQLRGL
jgi:hypothetical protein